MQTEHWQAGGHALACPISIACPAGPPAGHFSSKKNGPGFGLSPGKLFSLQRADARCRMFVENGLVKALTDGPETVIRPRFDPHALIGGTPAIDVAVVAEPPSSVIEQKLMADFTIRRHNKYRARVNLVIAWRDRRGCMRPLGQIFIVHEQAKRDKSRDRNNRVQGTSGARADL
jgi:hypothetical protein